MAANLSDRIIDSSKDVFQKITESDTVQKILMTGDLSGRHRAVAHSIYKNLSDLTPFSKKIFKNAVKLSGLTPEEKSFYQKMDEEYGSIYARYLDEVKAAVGPVPDDVMSTPVRPHLLQYMKNFSDPIDKGSVIHTLCSSLAGYAIPVGIYNYLVDSPSYKENILAKLLTFNTLGAEQALGAFKAFIDNRAKEVTPELESELKTMYKQMVEFNLDVIEIQYFEALNSE